MEGMCKKMQHHHPIIRNIFLPYLMTRMHFTLILLMTGHCLFAQHLQYRDHSRPPAGIKKKGADSVVYHKWPDHCPAESGSIPVLSNYVPKEMVLKLTEFYKGHLYSITSLKDAKGLTIFKLKVCIKGELKFVFADEAGNIINN
jgi:hypothetical protein